MPRRARTLGSEHYFHVINRSARRTPLFLRPKDYRGFLAILQRLVKQSSCQPRRVLHPVEPLASGRGSDGNRATVKAHSLGNDYPRRATAATAKNGRRRTHLPGPIQVARNRHVGSASAGCPLRGTQRADCQARPAGAGLAVVQHGGPPAIDRVNAVDRAAFLSSGAIPPCQREGSARDREPGPAASIDRDPRRQARGSAQRGEVDRCAGQHQTAPMLNARNISVSSSWPERCSHWNSGGIVNCGDQSERCVPRGMRGTFSVMRASVIAIPLIQPVSARAISQKCDRCGRRRGPNRLAEIGDMTVDGQFARECNPARQRVSIRVQAVGRRRDQLIARTRRPAMILL